MKKIPLRILPIYIFISFTSQILYCLQRHRVMHSCPGKIKNTLQLVAIWIFIFFLLGCSPSEAPTLPEIQVEAETESSNPSLEEAAQETPPETPSVAKESNILPNLETSSPEKVESKPCEDFFDAYTRITGGPQDSGEVKESELASLLAARMEENNVGCALLVGVDVTDFDTSQQIKESINYYSAILNLYQGKFVPLLDIDADTASEISVDLNNF